MTIVTTVTGVVGVVAGVEMLSKMNSNKGPLVPHEWARSGKPPSPPPPGSLNPPHTVSVVQATSDGPCWMDDPPRVILAREIAESMSERRPCGVSLVRGTAGVQPGAFYVRPPQPCPGV